MKKVGIITLHSNQNYGAVLQSYALQKKVCDLGYNAYIIDYVSNAALEDNKIISKKISVRGLIDVFRTSVNLKNRLIRRKNFLDFADKYYRLTKRYTEECMPKETELNMDVYITGSDQTFNILLKGNKKARYPYFLDFATGGKKISYAASMGEKIGQLTDDDKEWLKNALSTYSHISVREKAAADFIEKLGIKRPEITVDPTMLLTADEWDGIAMKSPKIKGKYILFYSVLSEQWVVDEVKKLSKQLNLPVLAPHLQNRYELFSGFKRVDYSSPEEFIALIKNAEFVCTTSFHASVFSIIYNKPLLSFILGEGNRLGTLLDMAKLKGRAVYKGDNIEEKIHNSTDFKCTNSIMADIRKKSTDILTDFIEN